MSTLSVPKRVLIVDDQPSVRQLLVETLSLSDERLELLEAADGAAALARLRDRAVDLVMTDLDMPGMNGVELIRRLRTTPSPPAIVVLSGAAREWISATAGEDLDDLPMLRKPLDLDRLLAVVAEQLER